MPKASLPRLGLTAALVAASLSAHAASLPEAAAALGAADARSIQFSGHGHWFQFGQAPAPALPWPQFDVSRYVADIDYEHAAARVQITRIQAEEPGRRRPAPGTQWLDQYVSGKFAWNLPAAHLPQNPAPQPAAAEERRAEILSTPHGFLKAALANGASAKPAKGGVEVAFSVDGKYRYTGVINAANQVECVRTWIDNPVLGDTLVETRFSDYRDFGGVKFPARIVREQGGHPVLALKVDEVWLNPALDIAVP